MTTASSTSTLQLACPTCGDEIEVETEYVTRRHGDGGDGHIEVISLKTSCFCPLSRDEAYDLLLDHGARQAELATERAGERG